MDHTIARPIDFDSVTKKSRGSTSLILGSLGRNPLAIIGMVLFVLMIIIALLAPWISPYDPLAIDGKNMMAAPNQAHPLGTDDLGRDLLSRVFWGGRESLKAGYIAVLIGMAGGIVIGTVSGFYGGIVDNLIQRGIEVFLAFPNILLTLSFVAVLGPGLTSVMLAIGLARIPSYARMVRGSVLDAQTRDYITAAKLIGARDTRIMFKHILPNIIGPILVYTFVGVGGAIAMTAGLSYIGLGAQPPSAEWGAMLNLGRDYMRIAPWMSFFPGLMIAISVFSINLFGDAFRDALDPKTRDL